MIRATCANNAFRDWIGDRNQSLCVVETNRRRCLCCMLCDARVPATCSPYTAVTAPAPTICLHLHALVTTDAVSLILTADGTMCAHFCVTFEQLVEIYLPYRMVKSFDVR